MRGFCFGIAGLLISIMAVAQDRLLADQDSVVVLATDSLNRDLAVGARQLQEPQNTHIHKIIPRQATIRSLLLPGLGQAYNRQYWKVPVIYGGFAALAFFVNFNHERYIHYRTYWKQAYYSVNKTATLPGLSFAVGASSLERETKRWERYRNLNILGCFILYALNMIDANVTAHLKTFDISEDLSLKLEPAFTPSVSLYGVPLIAPGIRVAFLFTH